MIVIWSAMAALAIYKTYQEGFDSGYQEKTIEIVALQEQQKKINDQASKSVEQKNKTITGKLAIELEKDDRQMQVIEKEVIRYVVQKDDDCFVSTDAVQLLNCAIDVANGKNSEVPCGRNIVNTVPPDT